MHLILRIGLRSALLCTLSLLTTALLAQTTIHVGPGQTYTTIQLGIDAASAGDTVMVAPGTYDENIDFKGKGITVKSSEGASSTIIDGGSKAPAVYFKTAETSAATISGFTIQNGGNNPADGTVGGIYLYLSTPTISNNVITHSRCWDINSLNSAPLIQNNTISATQDADGGCSFGGGAAIIVWGGINGYNSGNVNSGLIIGNTIEDNVESGLEDAGGNGGAAIAVWGGAPIILNNIIRNNATVVGTGGAINFVNSEFTVIAQNLIYGNSAGCGGGAIATDGHDLLIMNNTIVDNIHTDNWGFSNCIAIAQIYPDPLAYGLDSPSDVFVNNIISGSTSDPAVNCSWFDTPDEANQPTFRNNVLYNAGGPFFGSYCVDVSGKYNNIAADPQFVNPAKGDYHLKSTSPAIDRGDNSALDTFLTMTGFALSIDLDGNQRVQDATGKGCIVDMGAYEVHGTVGACGTTETLTSSLNPALAGQNVTFTARLSATSGTPTGTIEFLDGAKPLSTQIVSNIGSANFTTSTLTVGSHKITANYQPTGTFGASTASLIQVINGDTTSTALSCIPNPIGISDTAQLTATVTSAYGTPTGSISFTDDGTLLATRSLAGGTTSLAYTGSIAGTHNIVASYKPSGSFAASSASCSEVVNALPTTSTLTVAPPASTYGSSVTLTATVSPVTLPGPGTPTGVVTFYHGATAIGTGTLAGGVATMTSNSLPRGSYNLTCTYGGSTIYKASNCNPVHVVINAASTALTLSSSKNPATYLSPVTFTIDLTVNGRSAGAGNTIHLGINGAAVNLTTDAAGSSTYTIATLLPGSYPVNADSTATSDLLASSASMTQVITAAPTSISLAASPNPGNLNQSVTMTATVSSQSTAVGNGNVTFYDGATSLGLSPLSAAGTASLASTFTAVGIHNLTAVYNGSTNFSTSTSAVLKEAIVAGDFSISAKPDAVRVYTGESAALQVDVARLKGLNQPLSLSCSGLPANATCSFSPATLPQGQGASKLVIQTAAPHKAAAASGSALGMLLLLLLPKRRGRFLARFSAVLLTVCIAIGIAGCGASQITGGTPPGTYQVAVTASTVGSGTNITHSAVVTLTVKSLF